MVEIMSRKIRFLKRNRLVLITGVLGLIAVTIFLNLSQEGGPGMVNRLSETLMNKNRTIQVMVLSYQRSGSTFMGQLFNQNPHGFYWFEPGDAIYSNIYKTEFGWNVPADIFHFWNGTKRSLPPYELEGIVNTLSSIFTCDSSNFPTELLINNFHKKFYGDQKSLIPYIDCVRWTRVQQNIKECQTIIHKHNIICPKIFKPHLKNTSFCIRDDTHSEYQEALSLYNKCIDEGKKYIDKCVLKLVTACEKANIVAIKTVRITMETIRELLKKFPDLYVIHLIRDPRAVVASRYKSPGRGFASFFGSGEYVKEAQILCDQILQDVLLSKMLQKKYHSNILTVFYENLALSSNGTLHEIYEFIGKPVPHMVTNWLLENTNLKGRKNWTNRNSTFAAKHWMRQLNHEQVIKINSKCEKLYRELDSPWTDYYK